MNSGDMAASHSTSSGAVTLGGSSSAATFDYGETTSGVATLNAPITDTGAVQAAGITNTNLASSAVEPICGASSTAESQCQTSSLYATTGNASEATGTSANTYKQLGSSVSITTGVSHGANGEWLIKITMPLNASAGSQYVYGCVASASSYTLEDSTTNGGNNCVTSLVNSFAGGPGFGETASGTPVGTVGLSQIVSANVLVANGTTFTISGYVAASSSTSTTVYGHISMEAVWY